MVSHILVALLFGKVMEVESVQRTRVHLKIDDVDHIFELSDKLHVSTCL